MEKAKWKSYPRPQLKREGYKILNGMWELDGKKIQVPFAPQSRLSGYEGTIKEQMVYKTVFTIPKEFEKPCILLHFGAVDEVAKVYVNDVFVGKHEGGYLHFSFDISHVVNREQENILRVEVEDTLSRKYPYGKQCKKRGGMWYTPVSGIWQSVWMENVASSHIERIVIKPDLTGVDVEVIGEGIDSFEVNIALSNNEIYVMTSKRFM